MPDLKAPVNGPKGTSHFGTKAAARRAIWDRLQEERLALFPFPPHGRIPNFKGAREAAVRLFDHYPWATARCIKVNPDAPQRWVRLEALKRGIVVIMPTPRLSGGFLRFDPARIPPECFEDAARLSRCLRWAEPLALADVPAVDAIVAGAVAVTRSGRRCGKGEGYSDLEFAILRELGHSLAPVATTVHVCQIVEAFPIEENDLPLSLIVTPEESIVVPAPPPAPMGILWERLRKSDLHGIPLLRQLKVPSPADGDGADAPAVAAAARRPSQAASAAADQTAEPPPKR